MRVYSPETTMREGSGREVMVKKEEEEAGGGSSGGSGRPIVPSKAAILNRVRWAMLGRRMSRIDEAEGRALAAAPTAEDEDEIGRPGVDREDGAVAVAIGISSGPDLLSASKESSAFVIRAVVVVAARPRIRRTPGGP